MINLFKDDFLIYIFYHLLKTVADLHTNGVDELVGFHRKNDVLVESLMPKTQSIFSVSQS